jgi:hypothetical protein
MASRNVAAAVNEAEECRRSYRQNRRPSVSLNEIANDSAVCESRSQLCELPVARLPFRLLPPGNWDIAHVIEHYRRQGDSWSGACELQSDRLDDLLELRPLKCSVGDQGWRGYILLEFDWSRSAVLECPFEGNATYVLSGDWRGLLTMTKAQLLAQFPEQCTKIVHKGYWIGRVWEALYRDSFVAQREVRAQSAKGGT